MSEDTETAAQQASPEGADPARPLPRWAYAAIAVAIFGGTFALGKVSSPAIAALFLAAVAILGVVGFLFRTVQHLAVPPIDDEPEDIAPTQAEDAKRAALRALRDLEYERGIGNVSNEDYEKLLEKYRAEAKRAMRVVDEERKEARARAEKLVEQQLAAFLAKKPAEASEESEENEENEDESPEKEADSTKSEAAAKDDEASRACPKCSTKNDGDAVFCKKCGNDLSTKEASA